MGDDAIQRLYGKIDNLSDQIREMAERTARLETMLSEREKAGKGYSNIIAWAITTAIAIYGAIHN